MSFISPKFDYGSVDILVRQYIAYRAEADLEMVCQVLKDIYSNASRSQIGSAPSSHVSTNCKAVQGYL